VLASASADVGSFAQAPVKSRAAMQGVTKAIFTVLTMVSFVGLLTLLQQPSDHRREACEFRLLFGLGRRVVYAPATATKRASRAV